MPSNSSLKLRVPAVEHDAHLRLPLRLLLQVLGNRRELLQGGLQVFRYAPPRTFHRRVQNTAEKSICTVHCFALSTLTRFPLHHTHSAHSSSACASTVFTASSCKSGG